MSGKKRSPRCAFGTLPPEGAVAALGRRPDGKKGAAHVVTTRRTYKGKEYQAHLLRRSYREGDQVKNETLGNLSHLPEPVIEIIRRALRGEQFIVAGAALEIMRSQAHGHVQAVRTAMTGLRIAALLSSRRCIERDRILALVAARIIAPEANPLSMREWHATTLADEFGVADADEAGLAAAMSWLPRRQHAIEKKLAARHPGPHRLLPHDPGPHPLADLPGLLIDSPAPQPEDHSDRNHGPPPPIGHGLPADARILLDALARYVEWHMRKAWQDILPADIAPAKGFSILMAELSTIVRNTCRIPNDAAAPMETFVLTTAASPLQRRALALLEDIRV